MTIERIEERTDFSMLTALGRDFSKLSAEDLERNFYLKGTMSFDIDEIAHLRAALSSCAYAEKHMRQAKRFASKVELMAYCLEMAPNDGLLLEFGVYTGGSISQIARTRPNHAVYGFDSFEGLPDVWRPGFKIGDFALDRMPSVPPNVVLIKGWFNKTLPQFAAAAKGKTISLLHIDCDVYSSTVTIFSELRDMIVPGTIILFDEFFNYPHWERHEAKAFEEFCDATGKKCEFIGIVSRNQPAAVRVLG